jgi:hypothetical protein
VAKSKPAPPPPAKPAAGKPTPYPTTWSKMSLPERQAWIKQHRPGRPTGVAAPAPPSPAPPRPAPAPAPQPEQPQELPAAKPLVQIGVAAYNVRVGTREPVECDPANLQLRVDDELRAWEEQCQGERDQEDEEEQEF